MITLESFTDDPEQVNHMIKWWVSQSDYRYHRVKRRGDVGDFINDVWLRIYKEFADGHCVNCALSTAICKLCHWELHKYVTGSTTDRYWDFEYRMRNARPVVPEDLTYDFTPIEAIIDRTSLDHTIAWVLRSLTFREAVVIRARFGLLGDDPMTLEQVSVSLKVTRERIRQIESKAIKKIQHHKRAHRLIPFLADEHLLRIQMDHANRMRQSDVGEALYQELMRD